MRLEIRRLTGREVEHIRRVVRDDVNSRDPDYTAREWMATSFDEIRKIIIENRWSLSCALSSVSNGARIRREHQERCRQEWLNRHSRPLPYLDSEPGVSISERADEPAVWGCG